MRKTVLAILAAAVIGAGCGVSPSLENTILTMEPREREVAQGGEATFVVTYGHATLLQLQDDTNYWPQGVAELALEDDGRRVRFRSLPNAERSFPLTLWLSAYGDAGVGHDTVKIIVR